MFLVPNLQKHELCISFEFARDLWYLWYLWCHNDIRKRENINSILHVVPSPFNEIALIQSVPSSLIGQSNCFLVVT